jgi:hypothetical protein
LSVRRIRSAIREGRYELTTHALEEMDDDDLTLADLRALRRGRLAATLTDDPRGPRFVVRAVVRGGAREFELVVRFLPSGVLRIVTVYILPS